MTTHDSQGAVSEAITDRDAIGGISVGPDGVVPVGAAGTAIRSGAYCDGAGATQAWLVLGVWMLVGAALILTGRRTTAPSGS